MMVEKPPFQRGTNDAFEAVERHDLEGLSLAAIRSMSTQNRRTSKIQHKTSNIEDEKIQAPCALKEQLPL
jgi:hypothetical protein